MLLRRTCIFEYLHHTEKASPVATGAGSRRPGWRVPSRVAIPMDVEAARVEAIAGRGPPGTPRDPAKTGAPKLTFRKLVVCCCDATHAWRF